VLSAKAHAATERLMAGKGWSADQAYRWLCHAAAADGIAVDAAAERVLNGQLRPR
jgi:AmiR/NasT family two-component response regulator